MADILTTLLGNGSVPLIGPIAFGIGGIADAYEQEQKRKQDWEIFLQQMALQKQQLGEQSREFGLSNALGNRSLDVNDVNSNRGMTLGSENQFDQNYWKAKEEARRRFRTGAMQALSGNPPAPSAGNTGGV